MFRKPKTNPVRDNIALAVFSTCYMALRQIELTRSKEGEVYAFDDIWTASAIDAYRLADAALYVRDHPELVPKPNSLLSSSGGSTVKSTQQQTPSGGPPPPSA